MTTDMVTGYNSSTNGKQTLVVTYNGATANFSVTVGEEKKYFTFGTNGSENVVETASTTVTSTELSNLKYIISGLQADLGCLPLEIDSTRMVRQ